LIKLSKQEKDYRSFAWIVGGVAGILFGIVFPWLKGIETRWWLVVPSAALAAAGALFPAYLGPVYRIWMKVGHVLGKINTFILLHIVFYCIFTPMAFVLRITGWSSSVREVPDGKASTYRAPSAAQPKERMEEIF
jgi:hypothetical protein